MGESQCLWYVIIVSYNVLLLSSSSEVSSIAAVAVTAQNWLALCYSLLDEVMAVMIYLNHCTVPKLRHQIKMFSTLMPTSHLSMTWNLLPKIMTVSSNMQYAENNCNVSPVEMRFSSLRIR